MDIRNITKVEPMMVHGGAVKAWIMFDRENDGLRSIKFLSEFDISGGAKVEPHTHEEHHEFVYFLFGRGEVWIDGETKEVVPGDVVWIPVKAAHTIKSSNRDSPVHGIAIAVSV